jgi:hypothetical protein
MMTDQTPRLTHCDSTVGRSSVIVKETLLHAIAVPVMAVRMGINNTMASKLSWEMP